MYKRLFLMFFCLASAWHTQAALIYGTFRNAFSSDRVGMIVPHYYIDGKSDTYRRELDFRMEFSFEFDLTEPQLVFLEFNEERLPLFLSPNDTLELRADAFKFPIVAQFSGKAGANNVLLQTYLRENLQDFDEFNNVRFKIGQWWATVEVPMNQMMEALSPGPFRDSMDHRKLAATTLLDEFNTQNPNALSSDFRAFLSAEITYYWAYHLLVYGHVFGNIHRVETPFFDFLYEAPTQHPMIGSEWYRQYLLALMARQQSKSGKIDQFWAGQYERSGTLLEGKPLAFFRSEMINIAFSIELYREILPLFNDFMQNNQVPGYDEKVADLYQKFAKVSPGTPAPRFSGLDANGNTVDLSQFKGKVVYLNFWASWCGSCIKKMEYLNAFVPDFKAKGIEMINVSIDASPESWRDALAARAFEGYNMLASAGKPQNIAKVYGVEAIPQYFIIDANGAFADKARGNQPADIRSKLLEFAH
jgi:peroxiredoxin